MSKRFSNILKATYVFLAFGFMFYFLSLNWAELKVYDWDVDSNYLLLAIMLTWIALLGPVVVFRFLFGKLADYRFSYPQVFRMFNLSFIGRYLPGKVWSVAGMVYFTGEYGISKRISMVIVVINEICSKSTGVFLGLGYLLLFENYPIIGVGALLVMIMSFAIIHPRILQGLIDVGSKAFKKESIKLDISYGSIIVCFITHLVFWGIYGVSLVFLVRAIAPSVEIPVFTAVSVLPLAWTAGFLAVILPGGVGVREGVIVTAFSAYMPAEIALILALSQRIISTVIESINAGVSLIIKKGR